MSIDDLLEKYPKLASEALTRADSMWILARVDGSIEWISESFSSFIGYTPSEFTRPDRPISWKDITLKDASYEADLAQVEQIVAGEIDSYRLRKFYIPKSGDPKFVELYVRAFRTPQDDKEPMLCIVEVKSLGNGNERVARMYEALSRQTVEGLQSIESGIESLTDTVKQCNETSLNGLVNWLVGHPRVGVPTAILLSVLLFGERIGELLQTVLSGFLK